MDGFQNIPARNTAVRAFCRRERQVNQHMGIAAGPIQAAVIVAHPDDEILWAGGMILSHPEYQWFIACLCRQSDADRSTKFQRILEILHAGGEMADLDDGPEQLPLPIHDIQKVLVRLLAERRFHLILTHAPSGEYTRHRRHEEVSRAVIDLWMRGSLQAQRLALFAYEDDHGKQLPHAIQTADLVRPLPAGLHAEKRRLITEVYGFDHASWEARTTPQVEAFWFFESPRQLEGWLKAKGLFENPALI